MNLARGLERRLERLVEGISSALFRGRLHPVEIGNRLVREADLAARATTGGAEVPNQFRLTMHPSQLVDIDIENLSTELIATLTVTGNERGWRFPGPTSVTIATDDTLPAGALHIDTQRVPGKVKPWGYLVPNDGGTNMPLTHNGAVIGRANDADVVVPIPEISRHHARIWHEGNQVWVVDLESANGTLLNGSQVMEPAPVRAGDQLTFGPASFGFARVAS